MLELLPPIAEPLPPPPPLNKATLLPVRQPAKSPTHFAHLHSPIINEFIVLAA
jgi:hypothetical protein